MDDKTKELFNTVTDYGATAVPIILGSSLAYLGLAPESVTLIGLSLATVTKMGISEVAARFMSRREQFKIATALCFASEKIKQNLDRGLTQKYMDLNNGVQRSNAEEILEGAMLKSKIENEEKKLRFIGNIWANFAFREDFSAQEANHFLNLIISMSYTKLCLMAFFGDKNLDRSKLRAKDFKSDWLNWIDSDVSVLQQCFELHNAGLIVTVLSDSEDPNEFLPSAIVANLSYLVQSNWSGITPSQAYLSRFGEKFYSILELQDLPDSDLFSLRQLFYQQGNQ